MKKLATAIGALALANSASAFDPTVPGSVELSLDISGATAIEQSLAAFLLDSFCDAGFEKRFYTDEFDAVELRQFDRRFAVACTITDASTGTTLAASPAQALIRKQGAGGSASGVAPVCDQSASQDFVDPAGGGCDAAASGTDTSGPSAVGVFSCTGALESVVPEIGFSDVSPTEVLEDASANCTDVVGGVVTPFTVPVTTKLRDALQLAQGLTVGDETADNVPSMAASLYTSLTTGLVLRWSDIEVNGVPLNEGHRWSALRHRRCGQLCWRFSGRYPCNALPPCAHLRYACSNGAGRQSPWLRS